MQNQVQRKVLVLLSLLTLFAAYVAFPSEWQYQGNFFGKQVNWQIKKSAIDFYFFKKHIYLDYQLKKGLDIQGGMQVVLQTDMSQIPAEDREAAIEASRNVIARRVDLYGISEPSITTSKLNEEYRLIVELPGVNDAQEALQLVGTTAELDFKLEKSLSDEEAAAASTSAAAFLQSFQATGLTGKQLKRAQMQFDPQTGKPVIALEFNDEGRELFADITKNNVGKPLVIFLDETPVTWPTISTPILDGRAIISGEFSVDDAKSLAIQLNSGALPVPIRVLEQQNIEASLGEESVQQSVQAGMLGLLFVMVFMILLYGWLGFVADLSLLMYAILTIALYKVFGVVLTLPGIAGLILTIGMAVDANILIFERMKEELRAGHSYRQAMELGFGRAWDSIKDANVASIITALVLINPLNFSFLNTSGLVRGFGITFLLGTLLSLFTGVFVSRLLLRVLMPKLKKKEWNAKL
jgi:preprotein translocase subunit SecD